MNNKRLAITFVALLVLYAGLVWSGISSLLTTFVAVALAVSLVLLVSRLAADAIRKAIWRLRNRLIVAYVFIAVIPVVLILALAGVGTWIVSGQVALYLVTSELDRRIASLENDARFLSHEKAPERDTAASQLAPLIRQRMPGVEMLLTGDVSGDQPFRYPAGNKIPNPSPAWKDFSGYVIRDGNYYCTAISSSGPSQAVLMAPLDSGLLAQLVPGIGVLSITRGESSVSANHIAGRVPEAANFLDFKAFWLGRLSFQPWENPEQARTDAAVIIQTRPSAVLRAVFANTTDNGQAALVIFAVIATLLLIVEVFSIVIGVSLSRTITEAVHGLYQGTSRIARGDFSHRIPVKGSDQLAELGRSFNDMTAQLETLVQVTREKERMQSELQIAGEVQNQLFPRSAPPMKTIQLIGLCRPALTVSGDYYDYLCLPNGNLAIAIGDVAGKGISAALLMASIQSIMRTQLAAGPRSPASVVEQLNRQLYASTSPEKYATLFFGIYDDQLRTLTYTNAGHLPPLLIHASGTELLEVTGTVVGLFPSVGYEERSVVVSPDDVLVGYTDGLTEPENSYGEEFGSERLAGVAASYRTAVPSDIAGSIMRAAAEWGSAAEMPDDMTLVIAKGLR